jgi:hypothetical protein
MAPAAGASVAVVSVAGASVAVVSVAGASVAGASVAGGWVAAGVCVAPPQAATSKPIIANTVIVLVSFNISSFSIRFFNTIVTSVEFGECESPPFQSRIGFYEKEWVRCALLFPLAFLSCDACKSNDSKLTAKLDWKHTLVKAAFRKLVLQPCHNNFVFSTACSNSC